jgi:hypothetical protein
MAGLTRVAYSSLIAYLIVALLVIGAVGACPGVGWAAFVASEATVPVPSVDRLADLSRLRAVLEHRVVAQRLADLGLSPAETAVRLGQLSDVQIHQLTQHLESLQPGGDSGLGVIIALLVIAILVVVLLQVSGHRVLITR